MSVPGPSALMGGVDLLAAGALLLLAGDGARRLLGRWLPPFREGDVLESVLLDLFLAGAVLYLLAALPGGLFLPGAVAVVLALGAAGGTVGLVGTVRRRMARHPAGSVERPPLGLPELIAIGSAVLVGTLEVFAASGAPTGNTFDSSVDSLFTSLLSLHGSLPLTLTPIGGAAVAYPQGSSVYFLVGQWVAGLPPARVPLLVTAPFQALVPVGAFALGRRWVGSRSAGAVLAVSSAVLLPMTRFLVGGSNDFVIAFPIVLLLAARAGEWAGPEAPPLDFAVFFGLLAGVSVTINPVGAEWVLLLLPLAALLRNELRGRAARVRWAGRWVLAALLGLLGGVLPLLALARGATGVRSGLGGASASGGFIGWTDPFVFGASNLARGPFLPLQVEVALLLVAGAFLLLARAAYGVGPFDRRLGALALGGVLSAVLWILFALGTSSSPALRGAEGLTSPSELSVLLYTMYGLLATLPLVAVVRLAEASRRAAPALGVRVGPPPPGAWRRWAPWLLAALIVLPGVVATADGTVSSLRSTYQDFSRVDTGDFALLAWAPGHLPAGARVLVAPGSAAEFLPGYDPSIVLLFPMYGAAWETNGSYLDLRTLLPNGTLGSSGAADLAALDVGFIVVTGNDSILFPAFSPAAFLGDPGFPELFHSGHAYVFERT